MNDLTITLEPRHLTKLRDGRPVCWDTSDGREALLLPEGAESPPTYDGLPVVILKPGDIDEIESDALLVRRLPWGQPDSTIVIEVAR